MVKILAAVLMVLCALLLSVTGDVLQLTGQPEVVQLAAGVIIALPMLGVALLALPVLLLIMGLATGLRWGRGALAAWALYIYFAAMAYVGAVEFNTEPLYLNPFLLPLVGGALILLAEGKREPVAPPAPSTDGPAVPSGAAPQRSRGAGRG